MYLMEREKNETTITDGLHSAKYFIILHRSGHSWQKTQNKIILKRWIILIIHRDIQR